MEGVNGMAWIFPGIPHSQCLTYFHRLCWNKNAVSVHIINVTTVNPLLSSRSQISPSSLLSPPPPPPPLHPYSLETLNMD